MGINPVTLAALINEIGIAELTRWLGGLHAEGRVVTQVEADAKLAEHVDDGNAKGLAFLAAHPARS